MKHLPITLSGLALCLWLPGSLLGQSAPRFESATITLAAPDTLRNRVVPAGPDRLWIPAMNLTWLIYTAYQEGLGTAWKVNGVPAELDTTYYAVEGRAAQPATQRELRRMLRSLLEERFGLEAREQTLEVEVQTLVRDRPDGTLGPNIREWDGTCANGAPTEEDDDYVPRCLSGYGGPGLFLEGATMYSAADLLSLPPSWEYLGTTMVQDHTGLEGRYSLRLEFPFPPPNQVVPSEEPELTSAPLNEAIREQWGLRLEKGQGVLHVIDVESVQPPTVDQGRD